MEEQFFLYYEELDWCEKFKKAGKKIWFTGLAGWYFESRNLRLKALFIPFYFCMMNYAVLAGIIRYFRKQQSAAWEKSKRKAA